MIQLIHCACSLGLLHFSLRYVATRMFEFWRPPITVREVLQTVTMVQLPIFLITTLHWPFWTSYAFGTGLMLHALVWPHDRETWVFAAYIPLAVLWNDTYGFWISLFENTVLEFATYWYCYPVASVMSWDHFCSASKKCTLKFRNLSSHNRWRLYQFVNELVANGVDTEIKED